MFTLSSDPGPGQPSVTLNSTTATTISLSWSVPNGSVVNSYEVVWKGNGITSSTTISDGSTSYTITRMEKETSYNITVTATNTVGSAVSEPVTGTTLRAGLAKENQSVFVHACVWLCVHMCVCLIHAIP